MAIEQFGKITYNDINDLQNNSITTGNLTCTGNIMCNTSGAGIVTANQYYGTKFKRTVLHSGNMKVGNRYTINWINYEFISISGVGYQTGSILLYVPDIAYLTDRGYNKDDNQYYVQNPWDATYYRCSFSFPTYTEIKLVSIYDGYDGWSTTDREIYVTGLN